MARGLPDYYNPDTAVSQRVVDMTSIMASIVRVAPIDGLGRPAFIETFGEGADRWHLDASGDAVVPVVRTQLPEITPASLYLDAGTLTGAGTCSALTQFFHPEATRFGFEVSISFIYDMGRMEVGIDVETGATEYTALWDMNIQTGALRLQVAGGMVTLDTLPWATSPYLWLPIKFAFDVSTGKYERFIMGSKRYDVSSYSMQTVPTTHAGRVFIGCQAYATGDGYNTIKLGHAILTLDEP
jgi:hypothetical protein